MTVPVIALFNNKGGVGKTSLVYHLSWMYSELGLNVIASDLDPQANLTAAFLEDDHIEAIWNDDTETNTVFKCIKPLTARTGDIAKAKLETINDNLRLLPGDLNLYKFEDNLSQDWPKCLDEDEGAFRVLTAFWRLMVSAANDNNCDLVLVDLGPNLGAINRAVLIATDHVVIPLSPDLFSLQGLKNLGPTLRDWRDGWKDRISRKPDTDFSVPDGSMSPVGYVVLQHSVRLDRPVKAYDKWIKQIPITYSEAVLGEEAIPNIAIDKDEHCLSLIKHYRSLMPMGQENRLPIFLLKPAHGAIGAHNNAVKAAYKDFEQLAKIIALRVGIEIPRKALFEI